MSKYVKLSSHLLSLRVEHVTMTFAEIERIIGFSLPRSAHLYPAWWSNQASPGHSQSSAWQSVGWRTGEVNLSEKKVTFFRAGTTVSLVSQELRGGDQEEIASALKAPYSGGGLTIAEAKSGLATHFGVPVENVEIIIKG